MKIERRPDNNELIIPTGFYVLSVEDKITMGDLVVTFGSEEWKASRNIGQSILPLSSKIYIRKIEK